jgi:hypothetical protein
MQSLKKLGKRLATVLALTALLQGITGASQTAAQERSREMVSWVVLFDSDVEFTADELRAELDRLWPGHFLPKRDDGSFVAEGTPGIQFMIQSRIPGASGTFMLHNMPAPYSEFSDMVDRISDASLRKVAQAHSGWISVDLISQSGAAEAYKFIGNVLARLAPPDAAVLLHPLRGTAVRFTADVRRRLAENGQVE